jgi:hypothetical protein
MKIAYYFLYVCCVSHGFMRRMAAGAVRLRRECPASRRRVGVWLVGADGVLRDSSD